ncbi:predicted protein [Naegleria gruberi]|uniref:E2 ubiquitin-conjugating enzyme n=1 Tax=Naegleria gruberi TaxID=5762 RepID=D2VDU5_NAEGR|nr:uncharacterized protein NAEGRDRAFT_33339 [Naegleria gruberi]EFC44962.1 predicted protein [Naegleria gruberi]|eukprot:XP_002677706.1 predicted protein [Naegleria gruberi strain NEG-M]
MKSKSSISDFLSKRIQKELYIFNSDPPPQCKAKPQSESNLKKWLAIIEGPEGTPYQGGFFHLSIDFPDDYPFKAPTIKFLTKIYHCNISKRGNICLDTLKDTWNPSLTISKVLLSILSLLSEPNPSDPLEAKIAKEYLENRKQHDKNAVVS